MDALTVVPKKRAEKRNIKRVEHENPFLEKQLKLIDEYKLLKERKKLDEKRR